MMELKRLVYLYIRMEAKIILLSIISFKDVDYV